MKVKLPKEVAEAIDNLRQMNKPDSHLIQVACNAERILYSPDRVIYEWCAEDNLIRFVGALINGWEVEETPEDKVREYYKRLENKAKIDAKMSSEYSVRTHETIEMTGILTTLKMLNIKIDGVNS